MQFSRFFAALLLISGFVSFAASQDMSSQDCGSCHESQFKTWTDAKHNQRGIVCAACHGPFHSGTLNGCTSCHTGEHKLDYKQWQFVKDYMVEGDTSDYYCIVCHDPHNPIKEKVLLCNSCHGAGNSEPQPRKSFRTSLQKAHNSFAEIAPRMDEDAWNRRIKSTGGKLMIGAAAAVIGAALIFPYIYTLAAFIKWLKRKFGKR
jgi:hypothetical protein